MAAPASLKTRFTINSCWPGGFHFGWLGFAARGAAALRGAGLLALRAAGFFAAPFFSLFAVFLAIEFPSGSRVFRHERIARSSKIMMGCRRHPPALRTASSLEALRPTPRIPGAGRRVEFRRLRRSTPVPGDGHAHRLAVYFAGRTTQIYPRALSLAGYRLRTHAGGGRIRARRDVGSGRTLPAQWPPRHPRDRTRAGGSQERLPAARPVRSGRRRERRTHLSPRHTPGEDAGRAATPRTGGAAPRAGRPPALRRARHRRNARTQPNRRFGGGARTGARAPGHLQQGRGDAAATRGQQADRPGGGAR